MRPAVLVVFLAVFSGCSSSDDAPPSPLFGGFTPASATAAILAPATCSVMGVGTVSMAGVAIVFADHDRACEVVQATRLCGTRESSTAVLALALEGVPGAGGVGPASTGTYPVLANPPTGPFQAATGDAARVGAMCSAASADAPDVTGGSITLSVIQANRVAGSLDLRFEGDQQFRQTFDVAVCTTAIDACENFVGCLDPACVPTTT